MIMRSALIGHRKGRAGESGRGEICKTDVEEDEKL